MGNGTAIQAASPDLDAQALPRFLSSVPTHAKTLSPSLRPSAELALAVAEQQLRPATKAEFRDNLGACLALVVPTGMSEEDRAQWLRAAWVTLDGIPADLLKIGCGVARRYSDHPSKIVPAILTEVDAIWKRRRLNKSEVLAAIGKMETAPVPKDERCTPEQAREIRERLGLRLEDEEPTRRADYIPVEKRQAPTREDYIRWGIDPDAKAPEPPTEPASDALAVPKEKAA